MTYLTKQKKRSANLIQGPLKKKTINRLSRLKKRHEFIRNGIRL